MRSQGLSLLGAARLMRSKWDATWPVRRLGSTPGLPPVPAPAPAPADPDCHSLTQRSMAMARVASPPCTRPLSQCDRFVDQLRAYEQQLARPHRFSSTSLASLCLANILLGVGLAYLAKR